ncbi:exodeoxyribonuclease V subunit gamma [Entomomonas sp. E2T0]|uniref:exodeoxyribonuclease V subunit gamma n=1 Tax=Entomomonas sp. E2T0 TaxID=2930213 RepID=UPI0022281A54|nr:exodeoxyribonuclease V subunit gamma [Entomomonas sp. E2T0]UYZ85484.1 exodeoxyribonuclease V subunit gamma [Entomomonas sp. E2T0]
MIVHGNHLEQLRNLAVSWMQEHPLPPLEPEVILVQSNGIAQWLKLALAEDPINDGCGIAAAINIQLPSRFLWQTYRAVLGEKAVAKQSPLDKEPLTWRLLRLLPQCLNNHLFTTLKQFLADDIDQRKHYQLAEQLADLLDQYQVYRSDWLQDWLQGKDQLKNVHGKITPVPQEQLWQPALWRLLLEDLGEEVMQGSRAGVHQHFIEYCQQLTKAPKGLPKRISIFGISALPAQMVEALAILAKFTQVMLYVHNPCRYHWLDIIEGKQLLHHEYRRQKKKVNKLQIQDLHQHGHPLLAAWGKQGRDYINLLDSYDDPESYQQRFGIINEGKIDLYEAPNTNTLLGQLQDDILELRALPETRKQWPPINLEQDHSIRFHIAHSPQREVEILQDQLLDLFNNDKSLLPRDIIVMVPNIDQYTPFIQATFGKIDKQDKRYIPFTLSDRGKRKVEPLLIALEYLLQLPDSRFAVTDILDLLDVPAIRNRFNWREQDLPILHRWIHQAGIRWGLDAEQRHNLGLPTTMEQNSWFFGLRRMLLGYAIGNSDTNWQTIQPFDEIGGNQATLIGSLAQFIAVLDDIQQKLSQNLLPIEWATLLRQLLELLFEPSNEKEQELLTELANLLDDWLTLCEEANLNEQLPLTIVREAWLTGIDNERFTQNFIAGSVSFCTLMPMRAIPFKIICLLGMNDGDYPRPSTHLDFDLMAKDYRPGDRSRREDDRYLLLEALLSARNRLYISWIGRNIRDNSERPPSVLIGQLRDHLSSGWQLANSKDLLHALTQTHALQPFSRRYFHNDNNWFSYAQEWAGLYQENHTLTDEQKLAIFPADTPLTIEQLTSFLKHPVRYFFNQRLKVSFNQTREFMEDNEPFSLNGLQRYQITEQLLKNCLIYNQNEQLTQQILSNNIDNLQRSGQLPMAGFGQQLGLELINQLTPLLEQHRLLIAPYQQITAPLPINYQYQDIHLQSWLNNLYQINDENLLNCFTLPNTLLNGKDYKWQQLIAPWVIQLAANSCNIPLQTLVLGLDCYISLAPMNPQQATPLLNSLLTSCQQGMQQPLPVAIKTAFTLLSKNNLDLVQTAYEGTEYTLGECQQSAVLVRQYPSFELLNQHQQFEKWAEKLYQPIYQADWQLSTY